jgi:ribonuclease HII
MVSLDSRYPGYAFARHKGYGTLNHQIALNTLGISTIHRKTFRPIAVRLNPQLD